MSVSTLGLQGIKTFEQVSLDIVWSEDCLQELSGYLKTIKKVKE